MQTVACLVPPNKVESLLVMISQMIKIANAHADLGKPAPYKFGTPLAQHLGDLHDALVECMTNTATRRSFQM